MWFIVKRVLQGLRVWFGSGRRMALCEWALRQCSIIYVEAEVRILELVTDSDQACKYKYPGETYYHCLCDTRPEDLEHSKFDLKGYVIYENEEAADKERKSDKADKGDADLLVLSEQCGYLKQRSSYFVVCSVVAGLEKYQRRYHQDFERCTGVKSVISNV